MRRALTALAAALAAVAVPMVPAAAGAGHAAAHHRSFQALYLVASHAKASAGAPASIRADLDAIDGWFRSQTVGGVEPRWVPDTKPDGSSVISVATVRLPHPVKYYETSNQLELVAADLDGLGWPKGDADKLVAFFDAPSPGYCGITGQGLSLITEAACQIYPTKTDTWPYGATYVTAHEMTHNLGAVPSCAPHDDGTGHVGDNPHDLLYQGPKDRVWDHLKLDPGHDDYYDTGRKNCPDIKDAPYWTKPGPA